jgi:hypothetical protein
VEGLERLQSLLGRDHRAAVGLLVDALESPDAEETSAAHAAAGPPAAAPAAATRATRFESTVRPVGLLLDVVDVTALPRGVDARQVAARATTASEIEVRVLAPLDGQWWARALRADGAVVAAAPFRSDGDQLVGRLLVPPADLGAVEVDITARPGEPRDSARLRAFTRAVHAGRRAARAERLDRSQATREGWAEAANEFRVAGDHQRERLAVERVERGMPRRLLRFATGPQFRALLSDRAHGV